MELISTQHRSKREISRGPHTYCEPTARSCVPLEQKRSAWGRVHVRHGEAIRKGNHKLTSPDERLEGDRKRTFAVPVRLGSVVIGVADCVNGFDAVESEGGDRLPLASDHKVCIAERGHIGVMHRHHGKS